MVNLASEAYRRRLGQGSSQPDAWNESSCDWTAAANVSHGVCGERERERERGGGGGGGERDRLHADSWAHGWFSCVIPPLRHTVTSSP